MKKTVSALIGLALVGGGTLTALPAHATEETEFEVGLYIGKKIDLNKPATFSNMGVQTFLKYKEGEGWFGSFELPANVCGPGWAFQQDLVKVPKGTNFAWPATIPQGTPLIGSALVKDYHGVLSQLGVTVPDCAPEVPIKPAVVVTEVPSQSSDCTTKLITTVVTRTETDWILVDNVWVPGTPVVTPLPPTTTPAPVEVCPVVAPPVKENPEAPVVTPDAPQTVADVVPVVSTPETTPEDAVEVTEAPIADELAETGSGTTLGLALAAIVAGLVGFLFIRRGYKKVNA